jgi:hypothetical protein
LEQNEAAFTEVKTFEKDGLEVSKPVPSNEVAVTPKVTYGNRNGLTIPQIAPGRRLGHSLAVLFEAQVIEARREYWIINLGEREGLNAEMMVEIYEFTPDHETGRSYGTAQALEVRNRYSIVKIIDGRSKSRPGAGEKVILKYLYPAVNY